MNHSETVRRLLKIFETFNVEESMKLFANDATYQFGNYPAAVGIEQIKQTVAASHMDFIKSARFDVTSMIEPGDGVVACEMNIVYETTDGRTITLPCADLFRFNSKGLVSYMQIFMDAGPLFAPPASA
jgi:ketosteroid isomerase-like protein